MTVFEVRYNPCIHESAYRTLSIHKTKKGATKAMKVHKAKERKEWEEVYFDDKCLGKEYPFGIHEDWDVIETEILE